VCGGRIPVCDDLIRALRAVATTIADEVRRVESLAREARELRAYELRPVAGSLPTVVASDSSRVFRNFSVAIVFAVQAAAVRSSAGGYPALRTRGEAGGYVVSFEEREGSADEIVDRVSRFVARDMEVSVAAELLDGADLALFDGSLSSFLWYGKLPRVPEELRLTLPQRPRVLRELWRSIARRLLEVRGRVLPVFVAKSIRRSYYVRMVLPSIDQVGEGGRGGLNDLVLLDYMRRRGLLPRGPHVVEPVYVEKVEELPRPLKNLDPEDRGYVEPLLPVTVTYVTFGSGTQYYQVSIPGRLGPEEVAEVLSSLHPYSQTGYPDPLRVAHSRCRITGREFRLLLARLGLTRIPTGREPLGEFL
jgi:hypothetical protein